MVNDQISLNVALEEWGNLISKNPLIGNEDRGPKIYLDFITNNMEPADKGRDLGL